MTPSSVSGARGLRLAGWGCVLGILACGDFRSADPGPDERTAATFEQEQQPDPLQLHSLGYLDSGGAVASKSVPASRPVPARFGSKRDDQALSELEEKARQGYSQRANEAFDYLGRGSRGAAKVAGAIAAHKRAEGRISGTGRAGRGKLSLRDEARDLDELRSYRDLASSQLRKEQAATEPSLARDAPGPVENLPKIPSLSVAERFEHERRSLDGLSYLPSSGTWTNTYVPGDPVMRWLESRLEDRDRSALEAFASQPLVLDAGSRQASQPFDAPGSAALSVFVQADRRGLDGENRMLVQVGLKGAQRHSGLRPAMQVAIVLDLRGQLSAEAIASMRALVNGFLAAKDVGDRFSLVVAGEPGAELVAAEEFRHGPLSVALERLAKGARQVGANEPLWQLEQAVRTTSTQLRSGDDPSAPLGSSMILLVSSQPLGSLSEGLSQAAHASAISGVPLSVVGVGDGVELAEIERVALAGQGNLRLLNSAADAERLVNHELSALSRVIARALRLRIRLAPGVKLVEVVGSELLDATSAQQVRQAELSIDRRLARIGIEADRGEEDEGIQVVMPTFYSGDTHAVLLDVVAPGPGPIADVTVRYKDLVYLRNGVARANLTLGRSSEPPGPLEQNVTKNLLAVQLAQTLKQAGRDLLAGGDAQAVQEIQEFRLLLEELRDRVPGFQNDVDLADDATMLDEYLTVLHTDALAHAEPRQHLADSLQLSGYFKTVSRSASALRLTR